LARSGTHQGQSACILDQILPAIQSGRLLVWIEVSPKSLARLLPFRPALRGLMEVVRLEPQDQERTAALAQGLIARLGPKLRLTVEPGAIDAALSSARQYMSSGHLPGSAIDLIRSRSNRASKSGGSKLAAGDVLATLAQLTGLADQHSRQSMSASMLGRDPRLFLRRVIGAERGRRPPSSSAIAML
jgi:ATP-dependent Clp protease ATP-binding subunit ClpA